MAQLIAGHWFTVPISSVLPLPIGGHLFSMPFYALLPRWHGKPVPYCSYSGKRSPCRFFECDVKRRSHAGPMFRNWTETAQKSVINCNSATVPD